MKNKLTGIIIGSTLLVSSGIIVVHNDNLQTVGTQTATTTTEIVILHDNKVFTNDAKLKSVASKIIEIRHTRSVKFDTSGIMIQDDPIVEYFYYTNKVIPPEKNELIEERTRYRQTFSLGNNQYSQISYGNDVFYPNIDGTWREVKHATTSEEAYTNEVLNNTNKLLYFFLPKIAIATDSSPNISGTGANSAATGTIAWANPTRITSDDASYSTAAMNLICCQPRESYIQLIKGGVISGDNKANRTVGGQIITDRGFTSYGGTADLWGLSMSPSDINASNFGATWSLYAVPNPVTNWLQGTNFGFSIPTNATINGIKLEVDNKGNNGYPTAIISVDAMRITITYTVSGGGGDTGRVIIFE